MMETMIGIDELKARITPGAAVHEIGDGSWRLEIPDGSGGSYRLAQLDDYGGLGRSKFPWQGHTGLELQARVSTEIIPGTWGFGFWNDPFSMGVLNQGDRVRLPTLPNAAWFFNAGPPNDISLFDDQPGQGWLAQVFQAGRRPSLRLGLGAVLGPLAVFSTTGSWLRRFIRRELHQQSTSLVFNVTEWHTYRLDWLPEGVIYQVDGHQALKTNLTPYGPLGLVIWIDNQFAAWGADGRLRWGTLENRQKSWLELRQFRVFALEG